MSLYVVLKLTHMGAAIVAVGASLTYAYWLRRAGSDPARTIEALDGIRGLDRRFANPGYIVLLVTGLAMVWNAGYPLTTPWIAAAIVLYLAIAIVGIAVYAPALRRQRTEALRDTKSAAYAAASRLTSALGIFVTSAVTVIVGLMVLKPA